MTRDQRGLSLSIEFVVLLPALMLIMATLIGGGRLALARITVQQWADSAVRAASLARDPATARTQAQAVVTADADTSSVHCVGGPALNADTSAFSRPLGEAGQVTASVACRVPMADLLLPGVPGEFVVEAQASSTLDRYRGRR
ncbi:MAG: TadE/TadG family type IV pilus assembly protein [Propioniciclava sp.]|uniref:TadE/TadG family type IV pilus assembly protein n=1 Tax=Propioniciclava sp. TaxID=2038686 RepID=UPI0039E649EA